MPTTTHAAVTIRRGEDISAGDVLVGISDGNDRTITRIEPYPGTIFPTGTARLAYSGTEWAITLPNEQHFLVAAVQ